ncbi:MAG TPA: hypothetical protein VL860_07315 [Planctomycetota bacterium]|nr:hypothetical protein [Planctomycetota bacterium]
MILPTPWNLNPAKPPADLEFVSLRPPPVLSDYELQRAMGLAGKRPLRPAVQKQVDRMVAARLASAKPRLVLGIGRSQAVGALLPGFTTIHRYLEFAEHAALMAGTAGMTESTLDEACDPLFVFVDNAVSVALVRKLFRWARAYLKDRWNHCETGEPLTPGNCGVPLLLQRSLLSRLPLADVGIRYDEGQDLLWPLASVSGVIGVGAYEQVEGSACMRCPSQNCPLRETDFDPKKFQDLSWYCSKPKEQRLEA